MASVVEENVEVDGRFSEGAEEKGDLAAVVDGVDGGVVQEFAELHGLFWSVGEGEGDGAEEVFVGQVSQEGFPVRFDFVPAGEEGG